MIFLTALIYYLADINFKKDNKQLHTNLNLNESHSFLPEDNKEDDDEEEDKEFEVERKK